MRAKWRRGVLGFGLSGVLVALTLVIVGAATGDDGNPSRVQEGVSGNPRCPAGTAGAGSIKIDSNELVSGYNDGRISIPFRGGNPDSFDWALVDHSVKVMAVIVKGGNLANIYYYDGSVTSDSGLTPPLNGGDQNPQISHAEFCFDPKDAPTPKLTVEKTASGTSRIQHSWSIDKQVKIAGASDATYGDSASLSLPDGGNGSFTWKVTVTHSQTQAYAVTGKITLKNSGGVAITGVDVSDSIPGATIDCGNGQSTGITVPAITTVNCSYSVAPATQVDNNTATATWGSDGSAKAEAKIDWAAPTEVGVPAAVKDDGQINQSLGLGDLTNDSWTKTYDERWTCSHGTASPSTGRTNTATVTWDGGKTRTARAFRSDAGRRRPRRRTCVRTSTATRPRFRREW